MKAIVEAAGLKVADIVKTTVFVKDLNDFSIVNATYEAFFTEHSAPFPARSCVEVARLPKDVKSKSKPSPYVVNPSPSPHTAGYRQPHVVIYFSPLCLSLPIP